MGTGAGANVCAKTEGSGAVLVKKGAGGCGSTVVLGRSPALTRCWVTAARVAFVSVFINCCVTGGQKSSFTIRGPRGTSGSNTGVYAGSRRRRTPGVRRHHVLFEGGTVALYHRSGRGRGKNAGNLALNTGSRCQLFAEHQNQRRCPL